MDESRFCMLDLTSVPQFNRNLFPFIPFEFNDPKLRSWKWAATAIELHPVSGVVSASDLRHQLSVNDQVLEFLLLHINEIPASFTGKNIGFTGTIYQQYFPEMMFPTKKIPREKRKVNRSKLECVVDYANPINGKNRQLSFRYLTKKPEGWTSLFLDCRAPVGANFFLMRFKTN